MITNKTRGTVLCNTHEVAESSWQKTRGLMFRKALPGGHGLLMVFDPPARPGIWMMGMRFPIDMVFLDSSKRVIRVVENARPLGFGWRTWRVFYPPGPAGFVLELPAGKVRETRTATGDSVAFSPLAESRKGC
jgi:uncharacterized membrane protein (UPF0127 family)